MEKMEHYHSEKGVGNVPNKTEKRQCEIKNGVFAYINAHNIPDGRRDVPNPWIISARK
jgi:hypothetical protein